MLRSTITDTTPSSGEPLSFARNLERFLGREKSPPESPSFARFARSSSSFSGSGGSWRRARIFTPRVQSSVATASFAATMHSSTSWWDSS